MSAFPPPLDWVWKSIRPIESIVVPSAIDLYFISLFHFHWSIKYLLQYGKWVATIEKSSRWCFVSGFVFIFDSDTYTHTRFLSKFRTQFTFRNCNPINIQIIYTFGKKKQIYWMLYLQTDLVENWKLTVKTLLSMEQIMFIWATHGNKKIYSARAHKCVVRYSHMEFNTHIKIIWPILFQTQAPHSNLVCEADWRQL